MVEIDRSVVEEAAWAADLDTEKALYDGYSGRGMYGRKCFGVVGSMEDYSKFLVQLTQTDPDLAWDLAQSVASDSLGLDNIFYFPGYQLANEDDEEEDED